MIPQSGVAYLKSIFRIFVNIWLYSVLQKFVNASWFDRFRLLTHVLPKHRQNRATAPSTAQIKAFMNFLYRFNYIVPPGGRDGILQLLS